MSTDEEAQPVSAFTDDEAREALETDDVLMDSLDDLIVDDSDDDDPVLLRRNGDPVDTWREGYPYDERLSRDEYDGEKRLLQIELLKLQNWVKASRREDRHPLRGPGRGRQGRHDQALHGAPQPAWLPRGRAGEAQRAGAGRVVLPALRPPAADRRRDGLLRPVLVQPRRRRARHGFLHARGVPGVHAAGAGAGADVRPVRDQPGQVLVLGVAGRAAHPVRHPPGRPGAAVEALADGPPVARQVGRLHRGEGGDVLLHRHRRRAVDGGQEQRQEAGPARGHAARAEPLPLRGQGRRGRRRRRTRTIVGAAKDVYETGEHNDRHFPRL